MLFVKRDRKDSAWHVSTISRKIYLYLKLINKPQIIFIEQSDIRDLVTQHG